MLVQIPLVDTRVSAGCAFKRFFPRVCSFMRLQMRSLSESFVFVLDFSGSMYGNTQRAARMKRGIERFMMLDVDLEKDIKIGVTTFGDNAYIKQSLIPISD